MKSEEDDLWLPNKQEKKEVVPLIKPKAEKRNVQLESFEEVRHPTYDLPMSFFAESDECAQDKPTKLKAFLGNRNKSQFGN